MRSCGCVKLCRGCANAKASGIYLPQSCHVSAGAACFQTRSWFCRPSCQTPLFLFLLLLLLLPPPPHPCLLLHFVLALCCRYYESIQISGGSSWTTLTPAHSHAAFFNPLLFAAVVLAGAYAAVTAAFARNYDLTTYGERSRWRLLLLWPVLAVFSRRFWRQFSSALRGEKVRLQEQEGGVDVGVADGGVLTGPTTGSSSGNSGSGSRS